MIKQKFITFADDDGILNMIGIIHYVHDDDNLTIEIIDWLEAELMMIQGCAPSTKKEDILSEKCEDIKLSEHPECKLHYTWHTVIAEYVRSSRKWRKKTATDNILVKEGYLP